MSADDMNESLRKHLAEKVLEWAQGETEFQWNDKNGNRMLDGILFDPPNNISQAIDLLGEFEQWGISRNLIDDGYFVSIVDWSAELAPDKEWEAEHESLPMAISLACARASGWEE